VNNENELTQISEMQINSRRATMKCELGLICVMFDVLEPSNRFSFFAISLDSYHKRDTR
jgi:hypothetical protein